MVELLYSKRSHEFGCGSVWATGLEDAPFCSFIMYCLVHSLDANGLTMWQQRDYSLADLLFLLGDCLVTDLRDRLFALSGLISTVMQDLGLPDYSLSVSDVYQRVSIARLYTGVRMPHETFTIRGSRTSGLCLPTWCLDFTVFDWWQNDHERFQYASTACGMLKPVPVEHDERQGLLMLDGTEVDTIAHLARLPFAMPNLEAAINAADTESEIASLKNLLLQSVRAVQNFRERALQGLQRRLGSEEALRVFKAGNFWKAFAGGWALVPWTSAVERRHPYVDLGFARPNPTPPLEKDGLPAEYYVDMEIDFNAAFSNAEDNPALLQLDGAKDEFLRLLVSFVVCLVGLDGVMFCTENGYFGRCRDTAHAGDRVVILSREHFPVILRPDESGTYEHVSHAYVQGIMMGEFVEEPGKLDRRKFWLR